MLVLRSSPASPFARKCRIAVSILKLDDKVEVQGADTNDPDDSLHTQNPLGKIPVLVLENGAALFDSRVILAYLDSLAGGGRIIPTEPKKKIASLYMEALADGICDAAVLQVYEKRYRSPDQISSDWLARQSAKVASALQTLNAAPPPLSSEPTVGTIALSCALGYLDFRFEGAWRQDHEALVSWLDEFKDKVPAFEETAVEA